MRFQNVVGILSQVNKYHREIHVETEVRDIGGGRQAEVATLYPPQPGLPREQRRHGRRPGTSTADGFEGRRRTTRRPRSPRPFES